MKNYFLILPLLVLFTACGSSDSSNDENGSADSTNVKTIPVELAEVQPSTFKHYLNVQGNVESDKTIMISPKVSGTTQRVLVKVGDRVQRGQTLAQIDGEVTRSQINEVETQLELARTKYERRQKLREQNVGAEIDLLEAKNRVETLESQLQTLRQQLGNYSVKTSIAGRVSQVMVKEGESVSPSSPIFQVANSEALKVTAQISEAYLPRVEETDTVIVSFDNIEETITKRIDVVNEVIDPSNRTFGIEVFISSLNGQVRPNMLAKLRINDYSKDSVLVISVNNIQQSNGEGSLFVAHQTDSSLIAQKRTVKTGASYKDQIIVTDGLQAGDRIITVGDISDGDPIKPTNN